MPPNKKIIVVEDDLTTRVFLRGALNSAGYETMEAETGLPVLEMIRRHAPVLLITDILMDGQD
jgi:CheY-like chemotaxis protein